MWVVWVTCGLRFGSIFGLYMLDYMLDYIRDYIGIMSSLDLDYSWVVFGYYYMLFSFALSMTAMACAQL